LQKRDILWRNVKWDISIWKVMGFKKISHRHFIGRNVPRSMVTAMHNSIWGGSMKMESLFQLGWFYENGIIVPKDLEIANVWYHKAAAQQQTDALEKLK